MFQHITTPLTIINRKTHGQNTYKINKNISPMDIEANTEKRLVMRKEDALNNFYPCNFKLMDED